MTSVVDLWRGIEPDARLVSGDVERVLRPARGVVRTRAAPPHLPERVDGEVLVTDSSVVGDGRLDTLIAALRDAELAPVAVWIAGAPRELEPAGDALPVIAGGLAAPRVADAAGEYLDRETQVLVAVAADLRLAGAEAALVDPQPSAPAGVVAARLRRGIAVTLGGSMASLNPRPAGRALATRFAAMHHRLLADRAARHPGVRRTRDGLWLLERPIGSDAAAWLFDDAPLARIDEVGLEALAVTLRALLRRAPPAQPRDGRPRRMPPSTGDAVRDTLLAVARANGRIAPAARSLGVHRNTVLYRIRRASSELGLDPRRPEDALRLLKEERH